MKYPDNEAEDGIFFVLSFLLSQKLYDQIIDLIGEYKKSWVVRNVLKRLIPYKSNLKFNKQEMEIILPKLNVEHNIFVYLFSLVDSDEDLLNLLQDSWKSLAQ